MTIAEIAEIAGVSKTTVSRVLNGKPDVNPETREKIVAIIEKHDFTPNAFAKAMSSSKSNTIGLIIPYDAEYIFSNPFYVEVLRGISTLVNERGYYLMLCYPKDLNYVDFYKQKRVDGYILLSPGQKHSMIINELLSVEAPFISTARIPEQEGRLNYVDIDNFKPAYEMTKYLIGLGHKRIAYIGKATLSSSKERQHGYRKALEESGIPCDESLIVTLDDPMMKAGYETAVRLLRMADAPTALFFASDQMATGALSAAYDLEKQIPQEVSIAGFDDISAAEHLNPSLTTVHQPAYTKGFRAAQIFVDYLSEGIPMHNELLETELIIRKSTGAPLHRT